MLNENQDNLLNLSQEWLQIKKLSIKYSSYCKYELIIRLYIDPFFQRNSIEKLSEILVVSFIDDLMNDKKLSKSLILSIKYVLKSIYCYGEEKYHLKHIDFKYIKINQKKNEKEPLSYEEEMNLCQYCSSHKNKISVAIYLGLYSGLRLGEICALKWEDIDFDNEIIKINKTVQRLKNNRNDLSKTQLIITLPKSNSSYRNVVMPNFLTKYLKDYFIYLDVKEEEKQHFLLSNSDKVQEPRTIQRQFDKVCQLYGINSTFHILRHTFATNCIRAGIDIKTVSEILGHSSVNITLNRYVHTSFDYMKEQMNKMHIPISVIDEGNL